MRFVRDLFAQLVLLRDVGPGWSAVLVVVRLADRLVAPVTAVALSALVGTLLGPSGPQLFTTALMPLALLALVMLVGQMGEAAAEPLEYLVRSRVDGAYRGRLIRAAGARRGVAALEDRRNQVLLRQVRADPEHGIESTPGDGTVATIRWLCGLAGTVTTCVVLARFSWWLVPIVLVPAVITVVVRYRLLDLVTGGWERATKGELHTDVWREANVSPAEGKDIRVFGLRDWMVDRMQSQLREVNGPLWRSVDRVIRMEWVMVLLMLVGLVPAYFLVTRAALDGATTVTVQTAVLAAGWSLYQTGGSSLDLFHMSGAGRVRRSLARLRERWESMDEAAIEPADGARLLPERPAGLVRFENVGFTYPGTEHPVLDGLDLRVRTDELLAIVGLNGAGKSTLIKLLCGLYRPTSGRITVDGTDLAELEPEDWRSRLSVIFQDFNRYPLTARENVVLGAPPRSGTGDDEADLRAAAEEAGFVSVLSWLPDGWRTPLSRARSGGVDLSGGQWQQLALTRALFAARRGANLIVADEPTAHLDVRTEFELFGKLAERRSETGIVLISHRLSTVRRADRIALLDGGRITESGTHDELVARGGSYAEMFAVQARRFRDDAKEA
ncbi:ABC transporter ATP-binding protein [Nocardiopsis sp. JB363]|uniref:ABC transporter ATP-binding protein n=1 Tax=Nocardiopsis sp. JB363 TaxID=1434837 RepID=UPI00097A87E8|nr:ABC transporter ATP-binding protein [Nocardiopsis sp. JB363]SIO90492.1 ATP-binding protein of ABC transporter [Nocardiopsis sp. JB363]